MAYSVLIHGFVCLEPHCGLELEMDEFETAVLLTAPVEDPVYA